jgi:microsomal dipeptidase-like Zn-dependent dipeptidase
MRKSIGDLHCHPSLKPANNSKIRDIWTYKKNIYTRALFKGFLGVSPRRWLVNAFVKDLATYTQSNLDSCYEGDNRLLFLSIYPIERQFLKPDRPFQSSTKKQRVVLSRVFGINLKRHIDNKIIRILTGFSRPQVTEYLKSVYDSEYVDYFEADLFKEYKYIKDSHLSNSPSIANVNTPTFKLVSNYEEYLESIDNNIIAGIVTIEGMHALAKYRTTDLFGANTISDLSDEDQTALKDSFKTNINKLKDKDEFEYTPFFITFSHHFNNLISGQAKSFADPKNRTVPGFSNVFNQKKGLDLGITEFGKELIKDHLLSRANGSRILIDTKHMSLAGRNDYVEIVNSLRDNGDNVPIIISHTAINGISTREKAAQRNGTNQLDEKSYVSRWDINITDQDVEEVFESDGIIGVCMHDGRMPGGKFKKLYKGFKRGSKPNESLNRLHTQMFLTNVFHIVKVNLKLIRKYNSNNLDNKILEVDAWKTICLGSDNDGIVDPFDNFSTASTLDDFKHRVMKAIGYNFKPYWKNFRILSIDENSYSFFEKEEIYDLMLGLTPREISDRIFCDNIVLFLSKYFTEEYLDGNP